MTRIRRVPPTLRALVLVPLLAVAVDQARATLACGPRAETCLAAAGRGWLGAAGLVLLALYAVALAFGVGRLASHGAATRPRSALELWLLGSAGVAAACGGQAGIAAATGDPAALGGGWAQLVILCLVAGGVLALALRAAPAALELIAELRPGAPRPAPVPAPAAAFPALPFLPARAPRPPACAGRAPPSG